MDQKISRPRARVAALSRSRADDDPDLVGARRDLKAAKLEDYIRRVVSEAPPLSDDQRELLAGLLRPVPQHQRAEAA